MGSSLSTQDLLKDTQFQNKVVVITGSDNLAKVSSFLSYNVLVNVLSFYVEYCYYFDKTWCYCYYCL